MSKLLSVDFVLLETLVEHMAGRVKYHLGAKAPSLDCDSADIHEIDCSGAVRFWLHRAAGVTVDDGSANMRKWFVTHGYQSAPYSSCAKKDGILRIAFMPRTGGHGHVILVLDSRTMESNASHGVCREPWSIYANRGFVAYVAAKHST